ncbi:MAG: hypothetical protein QXR48_00395 [Candidatus Woesearchaeota archaeon]
MAKKERVLNFLGWIFIALGLVSVITHVVFGNWRYAVWFCNHAMIISGLAIMYKNRFWLTAMLNWSLIPVSMWTIDFVSKVLFGIFPFGITQYMFEGPIQIISLQHLFTVPLMLYAMHLLGRPTKWAWLGTTAHGIILWIISYFFITPDYNVNCAHQACTLLKGLPYYVALWPFIAILMFFVTNKFLVWAFSVPKAKHPKQ